MTIPGGPHPGDTLRALNAPRRIWVVANANARPSQLKIRGQLLTVREIQDRWRIHDEWWRREISREYFRVVVDAGRIHTVFHDLIEGGWYLQTAATAKNEPEPVSVLAPQPARKSNSASTAG